MIISDQFEPKYGQKAYHSKNHLAVGKTLLISSQGEENGCYGFFDIAPRYKPPFISVPSTGTIGQAFVQTVPCCVDDNCLILIPKKEYTIEYLFYVSLIIRNHKWRFMYGRQLTPERIGRIPILSHSEFKTNLRFVELVNRLIPKRNKVKEISYDREVKEVMISKLFNVDSGEYHSINDLKPGKVPLVSCKTTDNGISGFYSVPEKNIHKNCITVTYDGKPLTTKFHHYSFAAYDNVGVLTPLENLRKTTLIFITILLNMEQWRYSYGRKCYRNKLKLLKIKMPIKKGKIDEDYIEEIMMNRDLFNYFK